jgi:2-methylcitrate dehydratase PrpD
VAAHLAAQLDRWRTLQFADLPDDVVTFARHCLLDWAGCALAGSREPLARMIAAELVREQIVGGQVTLVGRTERTSARAAALANGAAGHALDFDDTNWMMSGHPTVPVLPAALALGEESRATGEELVAALVAGIEVECRVGAALGPVPYQVGWHATGTSGTFGAAAAAGRLLAIDASGWGHALGLAGTMAAGLKASFGTMAKPLHAGQAAANGVLAARLAQAGYTANPAIVEAPQGLAAASGAGVPDLSVLSRLADRWLIRDTLFKYHAACYLTHASINAASALRCELAAVGAVGAVQAVEVRVAPGSLDVCAIPAPQSGLEGKFSLRATTALALLGDDTASLATYSDRRMADPDLIAMRDRVTIVADQQLAATRSVVIVTTDNGRRLMAEDDTGRPADDLDQQQTRLAAKFLTLATPVVGQRRAEGIVEAVIGSPPDRWSSCELAALLAGQAERQ